MRIPGKVLQKGLLVILTCLLYTNICCAKVKEEPMGPYPIGCDPIEKYMRRSDFGVIGELQVNTKEVIDKNERIGGIIKIKSVIYGDSKTREIPFSVSPFPYMIDSDHGEGFSFASLLTFQLPSKLEIGQVVELIILGKGTGENITLICPVELPVLPYVKAVKKMEDMGKKEFQKQREKLLVDSNDLKIFAYLYRKSLKDEGVEGALLTIRALLNEKKVTRERKSLAYHLSVEILRDYPALVEFLRAHPGGINESQRKELITVIIKEWENIKTIREGLDHITGLDKRMFAQANELKEPLKKIVDILSDKFKNDKDYPEWQKAVKKLFPNEPPKPNEDK